ncbi:protease SohB, partial [Pseudomonas aeruginosa]|nr:protease SohB [Pseudomonas aeruginosa]
MEFIAEYAGFLARTVTVLAAIIVVLVVIVALRGRGRRGAGGHLDVQKLNDFYKDLRERVRHSVLDKTSLKALRKEESKAAKQAKKHPEQKSRVYVLDFDGDIKASATEQLRHEVTAVLSMAGKDDEVVLRLESGGGMVHGYGLAASQLARIR